MNRTLRAGAFALAAIMSSAAAAPLPSLADTMKSGAMMTATADCKNADSMMMKMAHSDHSMIPAKMTGNADRDFAMMAMADQNNMAAMSKVEIKCGKNPKARAAAQAMLDLLNRYKADLDLVTHTP